MLEEYVDDLTKRLRDRREAETAKIISGADNVDLVRGRAQAYQQAISDVDDVYAAHMEPQSAPEHLSEPPKRQSYGRMHRRTA
jgi:hypothetical protein